jgi:hypothetical protein
VSFTTGVHGGCNHLSAPASVGAGICRRRHLLAPVKSGITQLSQLRGKKLAVYISDMKLIGVLKPSTDPARFASRIYADVLA